MMHSFGCHEQQFSKIVSGKIVIVNMLHKDEEEEEGFSMFFAYWSRFPSTLTLCICPLRRHFHLDRRLLNIFVVAIVFHYTVAAFWSLKSNTSILGLIVEKFYKNYLSFLTTHFPCRYVCPQHTWVHINIHRKNLVTKLASSHHINKIDLSSE